MPTFEEMIEQRISEFKSHGQTASRSRAINSLLHDYCRNNMDNMQALIEGRAEIIPKPE